MRKEIFIHKWEISDYSGRRCGKIVLFQGKKFSFCKKLTAWIRFDKYLIRWYDILWFAGFEGEEYGIKESGIDNLLDKFNQYIGENEIIKFVKEVEDFASNDNRFRWFYAKAHNLSKKELDKLSDEFIMGEFNKQYENDN